MTNQQPSLEVAGCGLCGSRDYRHLFDAGDYIYGNTGSWPVARCTSCGVVYMQPRIPPAQIGAYYPGNYYTSAIEPADPERKGWKRAAKDAAIRHHFGYSLRARHPLPQRALGWLLLPFTKRWSITRKYPRRAPGGRLLDVGCGNGQMLGEYRRLGWQTYGVEPDEPSAELARRGGHSVFTGLLTDATYPDQCFDAVTMWDALEHIPNPAEVMREIYRITKPGGMIYISVPNFGSAYGRIFRDRWFMFTAPLHYFHYTRATLTRLLEQSGFREVEVDYPLGDAGVRFTLAAAAGERSALGRVVRARPVWALLKLVDVVAPRGHLLACARRPA